MSHGRYHPPSSSPVANPPMLPSPIAACLVLPLAANDWLEGLIPFLFFVVWIVSQVVGVVRRLGGGKNPDGAAPNVGKPNGPQREARPPAIPAGDRDPRAADGDIQRQIEAFRRAQAEAGKRVPPRPSPRNPPASPTPAVPRRETVSVKTAPGVPPRPQQRDVSRTPSPAGDRPVASGRQQPSGTPPAILGGHGGEIGRHVEGAFAHDLAHDLAPASARAGAGDQSAIAPQTVPKAAHELVEMFRNPATIRQVILLREVLDRPIDRW